MAIAGALLVPNLVWQAGHDWTSVHFFLHPPTSATDESRPQYVADLLLLTNPLAVPVAVAGIVALARDRALRPLGFVTVATICAYLVLGGKSYYAGPVLLFALAAGAVPFDRCVTRRRLWRLGIPFALLLVVLLPIGLPVLPAAHRRSPRRRSPRAATTRTRSAGPGSPATSGARRAAPTSS